MSSVLDYQAELENVSNGSSGADNYYTSTPDSGSANDGNAGEAQAAQYVIDNLQESASVAGISDQLTSIITGGYSPYASPGSGTEAPGKYFSPKGTADEIEASKSLLDKTGDKLKAAGSWIKANKEIAELLTGMIGGAYTASEKRKAAAATAQGRIDEQNNAARIKREEAAAHSAAVSGLRPVKVGLINQPLKRMGGQPVFNSNGRVI